MLTSLCGEVLNTRTHFKENQCITSWYYLDIWLYMYWYCIPGIVSVRNYDHLQKLFGVVDLESIIHCSFVVIPEV